MTRLLNTPIIGPNVDIVDSSWIDMLAGLSRCGTRRTPPAFCAQAAGRPGRASSTAAAAKLHRFRRMSVPPHASARHLRPSPLDENRFMAWTLDDATKTGPVVCLDRNQKSYRRQLAAASAANLQQKL